MAIVRKKVWNEHVKLTATLFNAVSIGIIGVAIIGPIAQPENPFYGWVDGPIDKLIAFQGSEFTTPSLFSVIEWPVVALAAIIHAVAHVILRGQVDD